MTTSEPAATGPLRYVALGDSYTIGVSVDEAERWPNQLVGRLRGTAPLALAANLGVNGYTSGDLIADELPRVGPLAAGFVSVQIGVNDVVQGVADDRYLGNVRVILDELLQRLAATRIVTVATPDYTVTPQGARLGNPQQQARAIVAINATLASQAHVRGIAFVDIHDISLLAAGDRSLVARDGLHPSGPQYARWVDRIAPVVGQLLGR